MKNIFNKANAFPLAAGTIATVALLASGVFALAPYVAILAPVAALGVGLPFIISGAVLSAVTIAFSTVAINKNNTISQQEKFENLVAARKKEEAKERAELKAKGSVPDRIPLPYKETEAPAQENQPAKEEQSQGWFNSCIDKVRKFFTEIDKRQVLRLSTLGLLAWNFPLVNRGSGIAGNSTAVDNFTGNNVGTHASRANSSFAYPNPALQDPSKLQQLDEVCKKLDDAEKWYQNNHCIPNEGNTNNKNKSQGGVFSVFSNPWNSVKGFFSDANNSTNNSSDPKWHQDLYKLEDPEEILDGNVLNNLFYPKVDNGINTSKRQGTLIDSVELKKLTEVRTL